MDLKGKVKFLWTSGLQKCKRNCFLRSGGTGNNFRSGSKKIKNLWGVDTGGATSLASAPIHLNLKVIGGDLTSPMSMWKVCEPPDKLSKRSLT